MDEKTLTILLNREESKRLATLKAYLIRIGELDLKEEEKNEITLKLSEIDQRFEIIDSENTYNNSTYIGNVDILTNVLEIIRNDLV